jgi:hypothetical protein
MSREQGLTGGFLVLGFAIFIAGFLTGMLAIALIPVKPDLAALELMLFVLGLLIGMVVITLIWLIRSRRTSS